MLPIQIQPGLTGREFPYDPNGNMFTRVENNITYTQSWTPDNRLACVGWTNGTDTLEVRLVYDGDGSRLARINKANGVEVSKTVTIGGIYETERISGAVIKYYALAGQIIAMRRRANATAASVPTYLFSDHLGSSGLAAGSSGTILAVARCAPNCTF